MTSSKTLYNLRINKLDKNNPVIIKKELILLKIHYLLVLFQKRNLNRNK